jgi:hypothetical protein
MEYTKYTREDLKLLMDTLGPLLYLEVRDIIRSYDLAIMGSDGVVAACFFNTCLYTNVPRKQSQLLFHETLDNVPLYINAKDPVMRAVANWRLTIAK